MKHSLHRLGIGTLMALSGAMVVAVGCNGDNNNNSVAGSDGPTTTVTPVVHAVGNAVSGKDVFRNATFGNENFWTDAMRLPAGILAKSFTPVQALQAGLSVDSEAFASAPAAIISDADKAAILQELTTDLTPANAPKLNSVNTTVALINANAVIGISTKDTNNDGVINIANGDKTGATCALCHTITDASVFNLPGGGSIGKRLDGRANHNLNFGALLALADNTRAYLPLLQMQLVANNNQTLGRATTGLTKNSTEAEVDAYVSNPANYPVGTFDDTFDGNGDPNHNPALFRTDLAAPWGTEGAIARLDNFSNLVYTGLLDPTGITTTAGRAFLHQLGGAAGDEIVDSYVQVLAATNVTGYPFVTATAAASGVSGTEEAPLGVRVDNQKLLDMNAYLNSLQAPPGVVANAAAGQRGRNLFRTTGCTTCHNVDQTKPVPANIVAMKTIFPGDAPVTLAQRVPPLNPVLDTPGNIFDDKMAVVNASIRGDIRGTALPLLLDLARKPNFLHDSSVASLDALLNPSRGPTAPHPFYFSDSAQRADMVEFLRGL
jgi:cytochrome c2